tara:strand:- start:4122 stop:4799 length:678 start_codon:yes stop_codon:yes gene_type:complete
MEEHVGLAYTCLVLSFVLFVSSCYTLRNITENNLDSNFPLDPIDVTGHILIGVIIGLFFSPVTWSFWPGDEGTAYLIRFSFSAIVYCRFQIRNTKHWKGLSEKFKRGKGNGVPRCVHHLQTVNSQQEVKQPPSSYLKESVQFHIGIGFACTALLVAALSVGGSVHLLNSKLAWLPLWLFVPLIILPMLIARYFETWQPAEWRACAKEIYEVGKNATKRGPPLLVV